MNTKNLFYFLILFGCSPLKKDIQQSSKNSEYSSLLKDSRNVWPDHFSIKRFCTMMDSRKIKEASRYVNLALLVEPDNKNLHLLNGLVYEKRATMGESGCDELAAVAYQRSKGGSGLSWASLYFSGMRFFKEGQYEKAQKDLAKAFAYCSENPKISLALACASYCSRDLPVALFAIEKALKVSDHDAQVLNAAAIIFSASKKPNQAKRCLINLQKCDSSLYEKTLETVGRWNDFHKEVRIVPVSLENDDKKSSDEGDKKEKEDDKPPLITMDCVLLSHDEDHRTSKGNNLLEKLTLTLSGDGSSYDHPRFKYTGEQGGNGSRPGLGQTVSSWTKTFGYGITQSALQYSLNIMNVFKQTTSVMTRPTITTTVGQEGYFQQGSQYIGATPGSLTGSALASFDAGVMLQATPVSVQDGFVTIELTVEGSYFPVAPSESSGITDQVVRLEQSKVSSTVNVKLGKTALVGSVHMKARREDRSGFPGLSNIPFVQYFFGNLQTSDIVRSVVLLITPRVVGNKVNDKLCEKWRCELSTKVRRHLLKRGFEQFENDNNLCAIRDFFKDKAYLFRSQDIFFGRTSISLKKALWMLKSFLWY